MPNVSCQRMYFEYLVSNKDLELHCLLGHQKKDDIMWSLDRIDDITMSDRTKISALELPGKTKNNESSVKLNNS